MDKDITKKLHHIINFSNIKSIFASALMHIYYDKRIILYIHKKNTYQNSPASLKYVDTANIADALEFRSLNHIKNFENLLSEGETGYYAYLYGHCVHHSWVRHSPQTVYLYPFIPFTLKEKEAYIHYCHTKQTCRGKNIFPHILSKITSDFPKGWTIYIAADKKNISSQRSFEKAGFKRYEEIHMKIILGIKLRQTLRLSS